MSSMTQQVNKFNGALLSLKCKNEARYTHTRGVFAISCVYIYSYVFNVFLKRIVMGNTMKDKTLNKP